MEGYSDITLTLLMMLSLRLHVLLHSHISLKSYSILTEFGFDLLPFDYCFTMHISFYIISINMH